MVLKSKARLVPGFAFFLDLIVAGVSRVGGGDEKARALLGFFVGLKPHA
jgi:hypothetical protein